MNLDVSDEDIERVARERLTRAYSRGWRAAVVDLLDELERSHCFTTARARRTVSRIRARIETEEGETDGR